MLAQTVPAPVVVGEPVQFLDLSVPAASSWKWDFDFDGVAPRVDSEDQNPSHVFDSVGVYSVHLQVCNAYGCHSATHQLEVVAPPSIGELIFASGFESGSLDDWSGLLGSPPPGE